MLCLKSNPLFSFLAFLIWSSSISASESLAKRESRTSPPSGAVIVRHDAAFGEFTSIQAAVNSLPDDSSSRSIFIYSGTYSEQITISRDGPLTIYGSTTDTSSYTSNSVTITHSESAGQAGGDSKSATLNVEMNDFNLYNVNVTNTFGRASTNGQALAVSAIGKRHSYYGAAFVSYQDTVLAEAGAQFYGSCYIEGAVDYIFGEHAHAFFHKNTIASIAPGCITASGPSNPNDGIFVINESKIVLAPKATTKTYGNVYLGRPWSRYARVVVTNSNLGPQINSAGWRPWHSSQPNTENVLFAEYGNTGRGASGTRARFATDLASITGFGIADILGSNYTTWVDTSYL